jgi:hypothetical protein
MMQQAVTQPYSERNTEKRDGISSSGTNGAFADPTGQDSLQIYRVLEFVVGSFGLDSILITEGSIPEPSDVM